MSISKRSCTVFQLSLNAQQSFKGTVQKCLRFITLAQLRLSGSVTYSLVDLANGENCAQFKDKCLWKKAMSFLTQLCLPSTQTWHALSHIPLTISMVGWQGWLEATTEVGFSLCRLVFCDSPRPQKGLASMQSNL